MNPDEIVNDTLENETEIVEPESTESDSETPKDDSAVKSALAQKEHFREKYEKAEAERKALEAKLNKRVQEGPSPVLDVDDYIDISTSLDGLDARQKAYLAEQHKLSGKPMKDIRSSEDFQLWNEAYTARTQREAALKPSATQEQEEVVKPFTQRLKGASLEDKQRMLEEAGLYKEKRPRADKVDIGQKRSLY